MAEARVGGPDRCESEIGFIDGGEVRGLDADKEGEESVGGSGSGSGSGSGAIGWQ